MRIIEFLNTPPGEFFIRKHIQVLNDSEEFEIFPAYWQSSKSGIFYSGDNQKYVLLFNRNRQSAYQKAIKLFSNGFDKSFSDKVNVNLIKGIKPDHLHFHFAPLAAQLIPVLKKLEISFTLSFRGSELLINTRLSDQLKVSLEEVTKLSSGVHFVSESLQNSFENEFHFKHPNSAVIRTSIESGKFDDSKTDPISTDIKLIFIGRLHWVKGLSDLILGLNCALKKSNSANYHLEIIGEGPERNKLEFMINDLNLRDKVTLSGKLEHEVVLEKIKSSNALILPSLSEGFPNVIGEAMQMGIPVLASELPGITELFNENDFILFKPGDPESIGDAIHSFSCLDLNQLNKMKKSAYAKSQIFSDEHLHVSKFKDFFKEAKKSHGVLFQN